MQVSPAFLEEIFAAISQDPNTTLTVNLPLQQISIDANAKAENFDINPYKKENMTNGFDDIDYLLNIKEEISAFSKTTPL